MLAYSIKLQATALSVQRTLPAGRISLTGYRPLARSGALTRLAWPAARSHPTVPRPAGELFFKFIFKFILLYSKNLFLLPK